MHIASSEIIFMYSKKEDLVGVVVLLIFFFALILANNLTHYQVHAIYIFVAFAAM